MDELGELNLPEIEPVNLAPEFFSGEEGGVRLSSQEETATFPSLPPTSTELNLNSTAAPDEDDANVFNNVGTHSQGIELKFDDETCEFDEFLVLGVPNAGDKLTIGEIEGDKEQVQSQNDNDNETSLENDADAIVKDEEDEDRERKDGRRSSESGSVKPESGPSTPDKSGSAIVRLSLPAVPKVALGPARRISIPDKESLRREESSQPNANISPPRQTRGRLNLPTATSGGSKRKMESDSEDDDDVDEETSILNKRSTTRSGRQTRKIARFGHENEKTINDGSKRNARRTGGTGGRTRKSESTSGRKSQSQRSNNSYEDYGNDNEQQPDWDSAESDIFTPVRHTIVTIKSKYWKDPDGKMYYLNKFGRAFVLKFPKLCVKRLTSEEIKEIQKDLIEEAVRNTALVEICIDNFQSAIKAVEGGAKRIELCSSLAEGGLTPSSGFLSLVKSTFPETPVFVMIRPRGGDFVYSPEELKIMKMDIEHLKEKGADGFVFGVLTKDRQVDEEACSDLYYAAYPSDCTFHRAFDHVVDPIAALESVIKIGFSRILTSGLKASAMQGIPTLKRLVEASGDRITIMAGSGVNENNVKEIVKKTGVKEVHGSASKTITPSYSNNGKVSKVRMGVTDDTIMKVTSSRLVAGICKNARR